MEAGESIAIQVSGAACWHCGRAIHSGSQKFCTYCGARLDRGDARTRPAEHDAKVIASMLQGIEGLRKVESLREAHFQLGLQLLSDKDPAAAISAFEQASKALGSTPELKDILLPLAHTCELIEDRARAFRAYLELVAAGFPAIGAALLQAARQLSPAVANAQESFIVREWLPQACHRAAMHDHAYIHAFVGTVQVCLGQEEAAMSSLRDAATADAAAARSFVPNLLSVATLLATQNGESLEAHYFQARVYQALGDLTTALSHCDLSLKAKALQADGYPDAPVKRLRAELAEATGDSQGAANYYLDAGRSYGWLGELQVAVELLERSCALDKNNAVARWNLADTLLRWSDGTPSVDEIAQAERDDANGIDAATRRTNAIKRIQSERVQRALRVWEEGTAFAQPSSKESWMYSTRAFIATRLASLDDREESEDQYWEGIAYGEQGQLLGPTEPLRWANLSYLYRLVGMQRAALQCAREGMAVDAEQQDVIEELAINLTNLGYYDEASEIIAKRNPDAWNDYVRSHLALYGGNVSEALALIQKALKQAPKDMTYRWTLGLVQAAAGVPVQAYADIVRELGDQPPAEHVGTAGFARYMLGEYPEAIRLMRMDLERDVPLAQGETYCQLALACLGDGRIDEAREAFDNALPLLRDIEGLELCRIYLRLALRNHERWPRPKEAGEMLESRLATLDGKAMQLREGLAVDAWDAAVKELETALSKDGTTSSWCAIGATAGIARLQLAKRLWRPALEKYRALAKQDQRFNEASRGIVGAIDALIASSDELLRQGASEKALAGYEQAMRECGEHTLDPLRQARLLLRLYYSASLSHRADLRMRFEQALRAYEAAGITEGGQIAEDLVPLIPNRRAYWDLDRQLAIMTVSSTVRETKAGLRTALHAYLDRSFELAAANCSSDNMYSMVTPIAIEISADLTLPGSAEEWPFFTSYVPKLRERIQAEMGMTIPGVRMRGNNEGDMPSETYLFMVHEVPIVMGTVNMGRWYVPHPSATLADLGIESDSINPANDPVTQEAGAWITPAAVEKVEAAGLGPCFDAHAFIARHLEALLLRNLADFLDAQEVQRLLDEWSKEPGGAALIRRGLPDVRAQLRFGRMLRALLAERVPIRRWRDMFEVLGPEANFSDDIADLLIDVRLQLRDELAAAAAQREHHDLPESLENDLMPWLTRHDGVTFLAMPPEQTQEALSEIRELLPTGDCVLVVQHQEIRHSVWRLVQLEFPRAMVVTRAELHAGESIAQSAAEATRESVGASL